MLAVLVMSALIGLSAIALFSVTRLDMMIAGNKRRQTQASIAASSGINHFMALNIPANEISESIRDQRRYSKVIIPTTSLDRKRTFYTVSARVCCNRDGDLLPENTILIESTGMYMKGPRVIALEKLTATIISNE